MRQLQLKSWELTILIISFAFLPVAFQMAGASLFAIIYPKLSVSLSFLAERLGFLLVAIGLFILLKKLQLLKVNLNDVFPLSHLSWYLFYGITVLIIIPLVSTERESLLATLFWVLTNLLIAWQEELVYRYMIPRLLAIKLKSELVILILQSLIFTFIAHLDGDWLSSLLIRFPLGMLFYFTYKKSGHFLLPTLLHCTWNLFIIYVIGG